MKFDLLTLVTCFCLSLILLAMGFSLSACIIVPLIVVVLLTVVLMSGI